MFAKKDENREYQKEFKKLDKGVVLLETRIFNNNNLTVKQCLPVITKLLSLINQNPSLTTKEATDVFFSLTKLFQLKDSVLRKLCYLAIRDLANYAEDVIIITSSLMKDVTGTDDLIKASAAKALISIIEPSMLVSIERLLKQAFVDKNEALCSCSLINSMKFIKTNVDCVRKWVNEIHVAMNNDSPMVQYHSIGFYFEIKLNDKLSLLKILSKGSKFGFRSPLVNCFLIRVAVSLILQDPHSSENSQIFEFIESSLRHKTEMVVYEASRATVALSHVFLKDVSLAVSVLQVLLSSQKMISRHAAVRVIEKFADKHIQLVSSCSLDLEQLIVDSNKSISSMAIAGLLKIGNESSIDRLLKQVSSYVSDISDECRLVIINAIGSLCRKFPQKVESMLNFLIIILRDEGSYNLKKTIVDTIKTIITDMPQLIDEGLMALCELIEDCEHTNILVDCINLIGKLAPKTNSPAKFVRFINNRVLLETAEVRSAAINALLNFGLKCPPLKSSIFVLLEKCTKDVDNIVRERAVVSYQTLRYSLGKMNNRIKEALPNNLILIKSLRIYLDDDKKSLKPFDFSSLPKLPVNDNKINPQTSSNNCVLQNFSTVSEVKSKDTNSFTDLPNQYFLKVDECIKSLKNYAKLGKQFKTSTTVLLTESDLEYSVACTKRMYFGHVLLQFDLTISVNDQLLENIQINVNTSNDFKIIEKTFCDKLIPHEKSFALVLLEFPIDPTNVINSFNCSMSFTSKDCDPITHISDSEEGFKDQYLLENVEITMADHFNPLIIDDFDGEWDNLNGDDTLEETLQFDNLSSIKDLIDKMSQSIGLTFNDMDKSNNKVKKCQLKGSCRYLSETVPDSSSIFMAKIKFAHVSCNQVVSQFIIRSDNPLTSDLVLTALS